MMEQETRVIEQTYFVPLSGLDAVNYLVIASQVKVVAHEEVQAQHLHFIDELRSIIHLHKQHLRTVVVEDGSVLKSTNREVLSRMEDFFQRLEASGLRLCFRMWSIHSADELVRMALTEAEAVDNDGTADNDKWLSNNNGSGAVVGLLIVPDSLPVLILDSSNAHGEICVTQVPVWDVVPDELAQG